MNRALFALRPAEPQTSIFSVMRRHHRQRWDIIANCLATPHHSVWAPSMMQRPKGNRRWMSWNPSDVTPGVPP